MRPHPITAGEASKHDSNRSDRWEARATLWDIGDRRKRTWKCGRVVVSREAGVLVRFGEGNCSVAGVQRCGSFAACPVCSAQIAEVRRQEIAQAVTEWDAQGGRIALLTMTVRHRHGQRLSSLLDLISGAWRAATHGKAWDKQQREFGSAVVRTVKGRDGGRIASAVRIPTIRVVETTHGVKGWHPHVHALIFLPAGVTEADLQLLAGGMFHRWRDHVVKAGFEAPTRRRGVDVKLLDHKPDDVAEYFAKAVYKITAETASGMQTKTPKMGNRTPFQILADLVARGEVEDLQLWQEWERVSAGRRVIAWTLGFREHLGLLDEATDQEIVEDDKGGETVAHLTTAEWYALCAERSVCELFEAFEADYDTGRDWLARWLAGRPDDPAAEVLG